MSADPQGAPGTTPGAPVVPGQDGDSSESRHFDLDAERAKRQAARAEANKQPVTFTDHGKTYTLPEELPLTFVEDAHGGDITKAYRLLLGNDADEFFSHNPSIEDMEALSEAILKAYGVSKGEAPASQRS